MTVQDCLCRVVPKQSRCLASWDYFATLRSSMLATEASLLVLKVPVAPSLFTGQVALLLVAPEAPPQPPPGLPLPRSPPWRPCVVLAVIICHLL